MSLAVIKLKTRGRDRYEYCGAHIITELPHPIFNRSHIVMETREAIDLVNNNLALRADREGFEWAAVVNVLEKSPFADRAVVYFREFVRIF